MLFDLRQYYRDFSIFIGFILFKHAKHHQGTVLCINLLIKGLFQGLVWEIEAPSDGLLTMEICVVYVILSLCRINSNSDFADILKKANTFLFIIHHPLYPLQCSSNDNNDNNCVIFCETVVLTRSTELLQKAALHYLRLTESGQILLSKTALSNNAKMI